MLSLFAVASIFPLFRVFCFTNHRDLIVCRYMRPTATNFRTCPILLCRTNYSKNTFLNYCLALEAQSNCATCSWNISACYLSFFQFTTCRILSLYWNNVVLSIKKRAACVTLRISIYNHYLLKYHLCSLEIITGFCRNLDFWGTCSRLSLRVCSVFPIATTYPMDYNRAISPTTAVRSSVRWEWLRIKCRYPQPREWTGSLVSFNQILYRIWIWRRVCVGCAEGLSHESDKCK